MVTLMVKKELSQLLDQHLKLLDHLLKERNKKRINLLMNLLREKLIEERNHGKINKKND